MNTLTTVCADIVLILSIITMLSLLVVSFIFFYVRFSDRYYDIGAPINWLTIINLLTFCALISVLFFTKLYLSISQGIAFGLYALTTGMVFLSFLYLLATAFIFFKMVFTRLDDEDLLLIDSLTFIFGFAAFFLFIVLNSRAPLISYLFALSTKTLMPLIAKIDLAFTAISGILFFIGFLWRIGKGGEYVYVETYRKMGVLVLGGLFVMVLSSILFFNFQLIDFSSK